MSNLTNALVIVICLNVIMFLGQASILALNPDAVKFYNCNSNILGNFESNDCSGSNYTLMDDVKGQIPDTTNTVQESGSVNIITDTFNSIVTWFKTKLVSVGNSINYIFMIVSTPSQIAHTIGFSDSVSFAIGVLWYAITFFFILAFIFGRWD